MTELALSAPSRLHFGLLARGPLATRQFGGVGLMIERPRLEITARPSGDWEAHGPGSERVLSIARRVCGRLAELGASPCPLRFEVHDCPPAHCGFGTGTQLGLAVARLISEASGLPAPGSGRLADLSGRGRRSGIGLHGFQSGGLIVDGGRGASDRPPPLVARLEWPESWSILVLVPDLGVGLHGLDESRAFDALPPIPEAVTDRLARLVLLGILPAVAEADLRAFDDALTELQRRVGAGFAPAQGGNYAHPRLADLANRLRSGGLLAVGQSSWGPALYGVSEDRGLCEAALEEFRDFDGHGLRLGLVTTGARLGAAVRRRSGDSIRPPPGLRT